MSTPGQVTASTFTAPTPTTVISSLSNHCSLSSDLDHISGRKAVLRRFTQRRESTSPGDPAVLVLSLTYKNAKGLVTEHKLTGTGRMTLSSNVPAPMRPSPLPSMHLPTPGFPSPSGLFSHTPPAAGVCSKQEQGLHSGRGYPHTEALEMQGNKGSSGWKAQDSSQLEAISSISQNTVFCLTALRTK